MNTLQVRTVHVVVPSTIDDPTLPSGGNTYDRRVCAELAAAGWPVHELAVSGTWPHPDAAARAELATALAAVPDGSVVLIDGLVACGVPDVVVPEAGRLRIVVLVHLPLGDEAGLPAAVAAELTALERATLRAASAVVATSPWAVRRLVALHGLHADHVHVVIPGCDPAPVAAGTDGATALLCVGSVTPTKGHDLLVDALATITDRPWTCTLVGPLGRNPGYVTALRGAIDGHHLTDRITITGPRTGAGLEAIYAAADLLVLPSRAESYGMVVTEALSRGIPVLAAAVDGVPDTVGNASDGRVPGILVPPADVAALAAALRRWLDDHELRTELRRAALQRRATVDGWEVTARCLAQVLQR